MPTNRWRRCSARFTSLRLDCTVGWRVCPRVAVKVGSESGDCDSGTDGRAVRRQTEVEVIELRFAHYGQWGFIDEQWIGADVSLRRAVDIMRVVVDIVIF